MSNNVIHAVNNDDRRLVHCATIRDFNNIFIDEMKSQYIYIYRITTVMSTSNLIMVIDFSAALSKRL